MRLAASEIGDQGVPFTFYKFLKCVSLINHKKNLVRAYFMNLESKVWGIHVCLLWQIDSVRQRVKKFPSSV